MEEGCRYHVGEGARKSHCHRLHIFALLESDFNQAKRIIIGRRLSRILEDKSMLSDMQQGSWPGWQCVSAVLRKVLSHNIVRLTKQSAASVENDIVMCFDWLVNNLILMILTQLGIPRSAVKFLGRLWDPTIHLIKTIYGISDDFYTTSDSHPLYGPGQGSTCSPLFWLLCYWIIITSLDLSITAARFYSALEDVVIEITGVSFVDDTSLGVTSTYKHDPQLSMAENWDSKITTLVGWLQCLAQHWERLLFSTGGAINLQKSHWYLMTWVRNKGIPTLASISHRPGILQLTSGYTTDLETVLRIEPTAAFWTLGVYLSPSGDQKKQMAQDYYASLSSPHLTTEEAFGSYMIYLRSWLTSPLPCCSLTASQFRYIQAPALAALLPKLHLNCHTPCSVLFSSPTYGGLFIPDYYVDQGYGQMMKMVNLLEYYFLINNMHWFLNTSILPTP